MLLFSALPAIVLSVSLQCNALFVLSDGTSLEIQLEDTEPMRVKCHLPNASTNAPSNMTATHGNSTLLGSAKPPSTAPASPPKSTSPSTSASSGNTAPKTSASPVAPSSSKPTSTNSTATASPASSQPQPQPNSSATNTTIATSGSPTNVTSSANTSSSNTTASNPSSSASGDVSVTYEEFKKSVEACGFPAPSEDVHKNFIAGIPQSGIDSKRELAAFLAQILHESDGLRAKEEYACKGGTCPGQYDSGPGGQYYGRGYIQLTWMANYKEASEAIYGDDRLVQKPDQVATDDAVAWAVSFHYWKARVHDQPGVKEGKFGATTKAINGALECSGGANDKAKKRFDHYTKILTAWSIPDKPDESGCYN